MKRKVQECANCVNHRPSQFFVWIAGLQIPLCTLCWYGFSKGVSDDFVLFLANPQGTIQQMHEHAKSMLKKGKP